MKSQRRVKEERHKGIIKLPENNFKMAINLSMITLNVNGLNSPIKRHRLVGWIKKQHPSICCLQETHFSFTDID